MAIGAIYPDISGANRAQTGPIGYILIFAMILVGATAVLGIGATALADAQGQAEMDRAEHSLTLFDSRTAMVALGESGSQTVSFGLDSGTFGTRPNAGYLAIEHVNYTGTTDKILYNESLGAVLYRNGDRVLAYQGGGVWRLDPQGEAQMISPPEFHYRAATLTLPIIRVNGNSTGAGSVTARISSSTDARSVFPNESAQYSAATPRPYLNPIRNGTVHVYVKSRYYEGWAEYFRERTSGNVTVYHSNQTVKLRLMSLGGSPGNFDMPLEGESLGVGGFGDGHPIQDFSLTLQRDGNFNNGHWSLYSNEGGNEFEMHIWSTGKCTGGGAGTYNGHIDFSVYYYNGTTGEVREWQNTSIDPTDDDTAFDVDCSSGEITADFTSTNTNMTYQEIDMTGSDNKWCFGTHIADRSTPNVVTLNHHPEDGPTDFEAGVDNQTMDYVVNHYMSRMGINYELTVKDGPGNSECLSGGAGGGSSRVDETNSDGRLTYEEATGSRFITYLHVTENEVNVTMD